jgi:peptide/nickel transport system permease protein
LSKGSLKIGQRKLITGFQTILEGDLFYSFCKSKLTVAAGATAVLFILSAVFAPIVAPHNPFDLVTLSLLDALTPPFWCENG